jgi:hypothetical protein
MHHVPPVTFAMRRASQQADQLADIQPIPLGATPTTIDCKGGGIHHGVREPLRLPKTVQPATFPARFIATHHWRGVGEAKALFGLGDFLKEARLVTRCDTPLTWLLTMPWGETELPGFFAQCKGYKQDTLRCGILRLVGRCGHHGLSPPW